MVRHRTDDTDARRLRSGRAVCGAVVTLCVDAAVEWWCTGLATVTRVSRELNNVVVVGASLAGLRAVETLRQEGFDGAITVIGDEPRAPYDRPPLSKKVLAGEWGPERIQLRSPEVFAEIRADWRLGVTATGLDLDARTVAVLRAWRRQQLEQRLSTGQRDEDDFVFTRPDGKPIHPDFFSQSWAKLVRESGLRRIRLHDLRHTHASILLKANVPVKVVSERLGHSSPAFTMTVYQHVLPGMQADAAAAFGNAVFGAEK